VAFISTRRRRKNGRTTTIVKRSDFISKPEKAFWWYPVEHRLLYLQSLLHLLMGYCIQVMADSHRRIIGNVCLFLERNISVGMICLALL
jgi:hypothetical protein